MKKPKVYQCECCKRIITDPYRMLMREFYLSQEHKYIIGTFVTRKIKRKITLCGNCFQQISNASVTSSWER